MAPHERRGDWPEGHDPLPAALAGEVHEREPIQAKICRAQIEYLLDAATGVVEQRQHEIVATAFRGRPVRLPENRFNLLCREVAQNRSA